MEIGSTSDTWFRSCRKRERAWYVFNRARMSEPKGRCAARLCAGRNEEDVVRVLPLGLSVTVLWRKHDAGDCTIGTGLFRPFLRGILDRHLIEVQAELDPDLEHRRLALQVGEDGVTECIRVVAGVKRPLWQGRTGLAMPGKPRSWRRGRSYRRAACE